MEVAPFFVDFYHFLLIFTIFYQFSRFTHFCPDLHFVAIYALFPQFYFGQNSLLRNITRFLHVCVNFIILSGMQHLLTPEQQAIKKKLFYITSSMGRNQAGWMFRITERSLPSLTLNPGNCTNISHSMTQFCVLVWPKEKQKKRNFQTQGKNKSERPVDALAVKIRKTLMTDSLTDNFKSGDASASKNVVF